MQTDLLFSVFQTDALPGDTLTLKMYSINKGYYQLLIALLESQMSGNPFAGTPSSVPTNFSEGACGYFWAGSTCLQRCNTLFQNPTQ